MQNLVYKTFELNTDKEHFAKPVNLSGATTIKLTSLPNNVHCWVSTESNGTNLYPLINRGDGWANIPNPLYDLYVYTRGVTKDNEKIILNYTGQNDFFVYGNNSSEKVDRVGCIESFGQQALIDINNAIYKIYSRVEPVAQFMITGELETEKLGRYLHLPISNIASLGLKNDEYYRITQFGHIDIGGSDETNNNGSIEFNAHMCLFNNTNNVTFSNIADNNKFDFSNLYMLSKRPWKSEQKDIFDIWGMKYTSWYPESGGRIIFQNKGINLNNHDFILSGDIINDYEYWGICWNIIYANLVAQSHVSIIVTISKAHNSFIGA